MAFFDAVARKLGKALGFPERPATPAAPNPPTTKLDAESAPLDDSWAPPTVRQLDIPRVLPGPQNPDSMVVAIPSPMAERQRSLLQKYRGARFEDAFPNG